MLCIDGYSRKFFFFWFISGCFNGMITRLFMAVSGIILQRTRIKATTESISFFGFMVLERWVTELPW